MSDLLSANFGPAQSDKQPLPVTLASATTITPTTALTFVTGTAQVANIVPPTSGYCQVTLCFVTGGPGAFLTNGSTYPIMVAYQPIINRPITLHYDPSTKYWWPAAVV
jgi:hypothetical protein